MTIHFFGFSNAAFIFFKFHIFMDFTFSSLLYSTFSHLLYFKFSHLLYSTFLHLYIFTFSHLLHFWTFVFFIFSFWVSFSGRKLKFWSKSRTEDWIPVRFYEIGDTYSSQFNIRRLFEKDTETADLCVTSPRSGEISCFGILFKTVSYVHKPAAPVPLHFRGVFRILSRGGVK